MENRTAVSSLAIFRDGPAGLLSKAVLARRRPPASLPRSVKVLSGLATRLLPGYGPLLQVPHERLLAFDVSETVLVVAASEFTLQIRVPSGLLPMRAQEVPHG